MKKKLKFFIFNPFMLKTDWSKHWKKYNRIDYKGWIKFVGRAYRELSRYIKAENPKIIELGAGSGLNSLLLAKILNAKKVVLVDNNEEALKISKMNFKKEKLDNIAEFVKEDVFKLKLREKFDIVHSEGLIEHFHGEERIKIFEKHVELCKKGGYIIIFVPYMSLKYRLIRSTLEFINQWIYYDEVPYTKEELYNMLKTFNLKIIKMYNLPLTIYEVGFLAKKDF